MPTRLTFSKTLTKDIARCVELDKNSWPLGLLRQLADDLLSQTRLRGASPLAESRWLNLTGFCLRPGFGEGFDPQRVQRLFSLYPQGPVFANKPLVRAEWWILWRRVAGGLKAGQQRSLVQGLASAMMPAKGGKSRFAAQERVEIWMAVANMERLGAKDKVRWGRRLIEEIRPKKTRFALYWALARLGAREPLYGPVDCVIPPGEAAAWIDTLFQMDWPSPKPPADDPAAVGAADRGQDAGSRRRACEKRSFDGWRTGTRRRIGCGSSRRRCPGIGWTRPSFSANPCPRA